MAAKSKKECDKCPVSFFFFATTVFFGFFFYRKNKCTKLDKNTIQRLYTPYLYLNSSKSRADETVLPKFSFFAVFPFFPSF